MTKSVARASLLIRKDALNNECEDLFSAVKSLRGVHKVEVIHLTEWSNKSNRAVVTGFRRFDVRGTELGVAHAKALVASSGIQSADPYADHDHAACIAAAAKMGVPASWAHRSETYLSM